MDISNLNKIRFQSWWLILYKGSEELLILYNKCPELRKHVNSFVTSFAEENNFKYIFGNYCTRCGNCCKRENILVTGSDLFQIATHLGISEKELHSRYLSPCTSWSVYDGFIKLTCGKCPFLERNIAGQYTCSIYEYRPFGCRQFSPISNLCDKEAADLIEELDALDVENDKISVFLKSGIKEEKLFLTDKLKENFSYILSSLQSIENENIYEVGNVFRYLETGELDGKEKKEAVASSDRLSPVEDTENFEKQDYLFSIDSFFLEEIMFYPVTITLGYSIDGKKYNYHFNYSLDKDILENVKIFAGTVCKYIKENSPQILHNPVPVCYICGDCCRKSAIEIEPSDIRRLAGGLKMTEEEVRKKYIEVNYYSWNPGSGYIKKVLNEELGKKECSFLKRGEGEHYYCSVHAFKPKLCRSYKPGNYNCYRVMSDEYHYRLLSNMQSLYLDSRTLTVDTSYIYSERREPFTINWRNSLEKEVNGFLDCLKTYISVLLTRHSWE